MPDRLKIAKVLFPAEFVLFDHNPERLMVSRKSSTSSPGAGQADGAPASPGTLGTLFHAADPMTLNVRKARLIGPECKPMCDNLLNWMAPASGLLGAVAGALGLNSAKPPELLVQWGPPSVGFTVVAVLTKVNVNYLRITDAGIPVHAMVDLTLKEVPTVLSMTNPTSGGRPGRDRHVVHADETLMSIAAAAFGDPNAWRAIAEVNGIDDPQAIRPGDALYLPARDELRELAAAGRAER